MTTKTRKTSQAKAPTKSKAVTGASDAAREENAKAVAERSLRPSINAAAVAVEYAAPLGEQNIGALVNTLSDEIDSLWAGDMKRTEAMLYSQAHALQAIFMNLARRAAKQEYLKQWEAYLRMAMKAQNQCRMTLETLATIKNPPVVIVRQANINNGGQQQVNNGTQSSPLAPASAEEGSEKSAASSAAQAAPSTFSTSPKVAAPAFCAYVPEHTHAVNSSTEKTELLEARHGKRLDT